MVVVLPAPLGPRKATISPGWMLEVDAADGVDLAEVLGHPRQAHRRIAAARAGLEGLRRRRGHGPSVTVRHPEASPNRHDRGMTFVRTIGPSIRTFGRWWPGTPSSTMQGQARGNGGHG